MALMMLKVKCVIFVLIIGSITSVQSQFSFGIPENNDDDHLIFPEEYEDSDEEEVRVTRQRQSVNPCNSRYYKVVSNQPKRSYNYRFGSESSREHAICDRDLRPGWYRFQSLAGETIPTSCPGPNYCGTRAPVWMKGQIPSVDEGVISAIGCISTQGNCCSSQIPMLVMNCSDFIVYNLRPTPACPSAYCAGYEVPCPQGLSSDTGYTPCHFPVELKGVRVSHGLSRDGTKVEFFCDVTLGGKVVPEFVSLEVEWLVDDEVAQSEAFGLTEQHKGILHEDKWYIGQLLQCRARAKHTSINTFTSVVTSDYHNTGVLIPTDPILHATEGSEPIHIELQPGVPITCPPKKKPAKKAKKSDKKEEEAEEEPEECCVMFDIFTKVSSSGTPRCASGNSYDLAVLDRCTYKICDYDWNATHRLPIWALNDGLYGGHFDSDETFGSIIVEITSGEEKIPPRWQHIVLPPQEILIHQAQVHETCVVEDIIHTFDGIRYINNLEGTFAIYKHARLPMEVQVVRKTCQARGICNCAVAIRLGDLMIAFDVCTTGKIQTWSYTIDGSYIEPSNLRYLPRITRLSEGRSFIIEFTTGTRLILGPNLRYIKIFASKLDYGKTSGLCSSFDKDPGNDFSSFVGNVVCQVHTNITNTCEDFAKSWRLISDQSLFVGVFQTNDFFDDDDYFFDEGPPSPGHCSCSGLTADEEIILRPQSKTSGFATSVYSPYDDYQPEEQQEENESEKCSSRRCVEPSGDDITKQLLDLLTDEDFIFLGDEFSLNGDPTNLKPIFERKSNLELALSINGSEVSEDSAETYCRGMIEGMEATKLCREIVHIDVEKFINDCKLEVTNTKGTEWVADAMEHLRWECRDQVYHNLSVWEPQLGRKYGSPPLSLLSHLCINDCSGAGECEHGKCRCQSGYIGADCSVNTKVPPVVHGVGYRGACDIRAKPCSDVILWGHKFGHYHDIKCHFDIYRTQNVKAVPFLSHSVSTEGRLLTHQAVICRIPDLPIHDAKITTFYIPGEGIDKTKTLMRVSMSYGLSGARSEANDLTIFDSLCWACNDGALSCQPTPSQSCNVLSEPFGTNVDPFQSTSSFRNPTQLIFDNNEAPLEYSPGYFSPQTIPQQGNAQKNLKPHPSLSLSNQKLPSHIVSSHTKDPCLFPKDAGPCKSDIIRYYFDSTLRRCRRFIYGGCLGNSNNYLSQTDCLLSCNSKAIQSNVTTTMASASDFSLREMKAPTETQATPSSLVKCTLSNDPGNSDCIFDESIRYFYDSYMKKCRPFVFSGCGGNMNNFSSKQSCIEECHVES